MTVVKVLIQGIVISVILVYAPHFGLDDDQKDDFYDVVRKLIEKEIVVIAGSLIVPLEVAQKTTKLSVEVMIMELRARKCKRFLSFYLELEAKDRSCGWIKDPARHKETWCWNDKVSNIVREKHKL